MRRTTLICLIALVAPQICEGQSQLAVELDAGEFSELQDRINDKREIRVRTARGQFTLSDPTLVQGGTLYYGLPNQEGRDAMSLADVTEIQVQGSAAGKGAVIGGAVFGGLNLLLGVVILATDDSDWYDYDAGQVVVGTVAGAAVGALLGAAIASPFKKWKTVYRSQNRAQHPTITMVPRPEGGLAVAASVPF